MDESKRIYSKTTIMKVGTFFSGVGSPEQALKNLGIKHELEFACEIDKYAKEIFQKNFQVKEFYEDITKLDMKNLPYVDLLVFGFPCQAFSTAGKRKGFDDTRGTLFYDALRYLRQHKPRYFIAENVKGLVSHDNGKTFQTIIDSLAKTINYQFSIMPFENLGYHIHYKVLNTKNFGIPQNRERIFIVGIRDDEDNNFNFPKEIPLKLKLKDILQDNPYFIKKIYASTQEAGLKFSRTDMSSCLTSAMGEGGGHIPIVNIEKNSAYKVDDKYYLSEKQKKRLLERTKVDIKNIKESICFDVYNKKLVKDISICLTEPHHNNLRIVSHSLHPRSGDPTKGGTGHLSKSDGTSYCLDTGNAQAIEKQNTIRKLTPIECERLQGFPDNHTKGVSDTQRYKQMGNSITVNVMMAIIKNLI